MLRAFYLGLGSSSQLNKIQYLADVFTYSVVGVK